MALPAGDGSRHQPVCDTGHLAKCPVSQTALSTCVPTDGQYVMMCAADTNPEPGMHTRLGVLRQHAGSGWRGAPGCDERHQEAGDEGANEGAMEGASVMATPGPPKQKIQSKLDLFCWI